MDKSENARKVVHIGIGLFAFSLRWLSTWQAATVAGAAVLHNWLILPLYLGKKIARSERGWDLGIVIYPAAVLVLILAFPSRPELAASVWAILAFGDGFASIAGRGIRGPRLPWNHEKSVAGSVGFIVAGVLGASAAYHVVANLEGFDARGFAIVAATTVVCAIVESLPLNLDDNMTIPVTGGVAIALLATVTYAPKIAMDRTSWIWLGVNGILAVLGYLARSVNVSGMIGGFLLGAALILLAGWPLYVALLVFFIIGSTVTRFGYETKKKMGLAQEGEGRRGFSHAFSNVGVASICAALIATSTIDPTVLWLAAIGSLATAAADTSGSEIGQLFGRRAFLPLSLRGVPPGTEGAISVEGTAAGLIGGFLVAAIGSWFVQPALSAGGAVSPSLIALVTLITASAFVGSWIESVVGSWNRKRDRRVPNGALNFLNTAIGAFLAATLAVLIL